LFNIFSSKERAFQVEKEQKERRRRNSQRVQLFHHKTKHRVNQNMKEKRKIEQEKRDQVVALNFSFFFFDFSCRNLPLSKLPRKAKQKTFLHPRKQTKNITSPFGTEAQTMSLFLVWKLRFFFIWNLPAVSFEKKKKKDSTAQSCAPKMLFASRTPKNSKKTSIHASRANNSQNRASCPSFA
jgi:hypothetical protein